MRVDLRRLVLIAAWLVGSQAQAVLNIEITEGVQGGLPIAVVPFAGQGPQQVAEIVASDLERSGLFSIVPASDYPEQPRGDVEINTRAWRNAGVEAVVVGAIEQSGPDAYVVSFRLYDAIRGEQLAGYRIPARERTVRKAAHKISDLVFEALTGKRGAFSGRIAYIRSEIATDGRKRYLLQVADSDGFNPQTIYESMTPIMSPAWSPDGSRIAYVSFEAGRPEVYIQEVDTAQRSKASGQPGINSAPAWSPDGRQLALVLSVDGRAQVYLMNVATGAVRRLTQGPGINTEPAWMPDGRSLIFTSDRSGQPQLYRIPLIGGQAKRLTFDGRYNAAPAVSPDGRQVAMVHSAGSGYQIAILELDSGVLRPLTNGRLDESPSFAPNGSMVIYATEHRGAGVLAAVSEDGRVKQRLSEGGGDVREPVWSPFTD